MKVKLGIAFMQHLKNAQELITIGRNKDVSKEISFIRLMYFKYHLSDREMDEEELNEVWDKVQKIFGK